MAYDEIRNLLSSVDDPALRLEMVMDLGAQLPAVPDNANCEEIKGCASRVEICRAGNRFYANADSAIVRGIVAILISIVDGKTPDEIKKMDLHSMLSALHLNLGMGRLNGINSMILFLQNL